MNKVIYFDNQDQRAECCCRQKYIEFLDYAFSRTNYFMLVYVNYYGKGYSKIMKDYIKLLKPFEIKTRRNASWPGTLQQFCANTTYKVVFYRNSDDAKGILQSVNSMSEWSSPSYPQDLAFFEGNRCWFYSVGHEKIAAIIHATDKDLDFVENLGVAKRQNAYIPKDNYFDQYDEVLE